MSEFELAYLHNEYGNSISLTFGVYMTGLFAMLLASRYMASKLDLFMKGFLIFLFTLFTIFSGRGVFNSVRSYFAMGDILREGTWESQILKTLAENAPTEFQTHVAPFVILSIIILSYTGTIIYFLKSSKSNI